MGLTDRIVGFARWLGRGVRLATSRFPVAAAAILAISLLVNLEVRDGTVLDDETLGWLIAALFSGASASVGAALVLEARRASVAATQGAALAAGVAVGALVWFGDALGIFAPAFMAGTLLIVPLLPFARRAGRSDLAFWSFTLWSAVGGALAFLSVLLFMLGVSAILEMVRFLLEVGLSSDAYEHMFATAFTLVGPLFALGQIPRLAEHENPVLAEDRLLVGVRVLFDWVAVPLVLATGLVLHLYAAKILLQGTLPVNEIGWIVTLYAVLLLSLRIAIAPYAPIGAWPTRILARFWWALLLVPLGLLTYAVSLRVGSEGWTGERYYLALAALAAGLAILVQLVPRLRGSIVALGLVPCVLLLLSSAGPWGVTSTVARSQGGIVAERFTEDGRLLDGSRLAPERAEELRTRLYALDEVGRLGTLAPLVGSADLAARMEAASWAGDNAALDALTAALNLGYGAPASTGQFVTFVSATQEAIDTSGYDRVTPIIYATIDPPAEYDPALLGSPRLMRVVVRGMELSLHLGAQSARFDLGPALRGMPDAAFGGEPGSTPPLAVELTSADGRRHVRLAIHDLSMPADRSGLSSMSATVLFRAAEWAG